jgi:ABC-type nitrate/sulfonate/bicarbonate transport system substrate-binding protein
MKIAQWLAAGALAVASLAATAGQELEVIVFPGGFNWPIWAAEAQGYFADQGLKVKVTPTPNSVFQMQGLAEGKFDIGFSTVDNVVAYQEGQGEAPLSKQPDFFVFMGGQFGAVRLVVQPDVGSIADLKGKSLAVDAATTGYAFVLRKLLQQGGLGENDYSFDKLGGTAQRAEALMQNKTAGTILTSPLEVLPESRGYKRLANAVDVLGPYQAVSGIASRSWAKAHPDELVKFIRAYVRGLDWLSDPKNKSEAVALYRKNIPQANEIAAGKAWDALVPGPEGFQKKAKLDMAGVATVLSLRSEFGRPQKKLDDPSKYVDESYYQRAMGTP